MARTKQWNGAQFKVRKPDNTVLTITVKGRDRWALESLMAAGARGCTPIDTPGPRWSAYVFNLRAMQINVETATEAHSGDFPGSHARYVLKDSVERVQEASQ